MRTGIVWAALVVALGCNGDRPEINASQDTVCDEIAEVACYNLYQCCSEGEIEDFLGVDEPRTEAECFDDVRTLCERQLAAINFSLDNRHVRFDGAVLDACLEALVPPEGTCATIESMTPWTAACMESAWQGIVADGGKCDFAYECGADSYCNSSRTCTALPTANMSCSTRGCASGHYCDLGTCRVLVADGGACTANSQCARGLFCDTTEATRTCTPLRAIGESCAGNATCASATCLPGTCAGTGGNCFASTSCSAHCADDNSFCTTDSNCAAGTCTITGTACFSPTDCTTVGSICNFPVRCLPAACEGDIVCAETHAVVDYCQGALNSLPLFGNDR
jgi:Dickkopf N-terminal cysteine-rich region